MSSGDRFGDDRPYEEKYAEPDSKSPDDAVQKDAIQPKAVPQNDDRDSMLDKVLEVTDFDPNEPLSVEEMQALTNVAKRHRQRAFQLSPVAIDLVGAILRLRLNQPNTPKEYWDKISMEVATTLFDSPKVKSRLENFWQRLVEAVS